MKSSAKSINLTSLDDLFSTEESRAEESCEKVVRIPLSELHPFPNHPFHVRDDEAMQNTVDSIKEYGVLTPGIVRPREDGGYEIVAGHRRKHGSELAGLSDMPCIVREMDNDTATILMVDSNIQREDILPSERAQAYKMKLDAIRRKAGRPAKTAEKSDTRNSVQVGQNFDGKTSREILSQNSPDSSTQIQRYIRLTELQPELQQMVDDKKIAMTPAVELSYEAFMEALHRVSPVPIEVKPLRNDLDGFFSPSKQSITLRAGMSEVQTVCAAVHEIAHSKLHDYAKQPGSQPKDSSTEEIEAESIAYTVCAYFGIETSANSFGYVATWSKDKDLKAFKESLDTIRKTSSDLISGVEQQFKEICKERGISLEPENPTQEQPEQDTEKLYMVDNEKYIHVQRSDTGIDYTIYDAASAKALDGGVLDDTGQLLSAAALTVCKLHNIGDAAPIRLAPLELLNGLQEANELPLGADVQITGATVKSAAAPLPDLPQLEQGYPMPDPTVDFAQMYQFGYTDGNTMLPLSKERARELFLQDVPIFVLNSDNTEYMVLDTSDLDAHPGIFGVERTEWERVRDTLQPRRDIVAPKQPDALSYLHDDTAKTQPENYLKNAEMALEDDYSMIDGIINNGPKQTVAEQEERSSILAKLKAPVETTNRTEKHAPKRSAEKEL